MNKTISFNYRTAKEQEQIATLNTKISMHLIPTQKNKNDKCNGKKNGLKMITGWNLDKNNCLEEFKIS